MSYSARYADPNAIARRQVEMIARWGIPLAPGASVLELGCADGFVTRELVRAGYDVTAVDLSLDEVPNIDARFIQADVNDLELDRGYDAIAGFMWTFFAYVRDPEAVLHRFAPRARKIIVDLNPRTHDLRRGLAAMRGPVTWRPVFVPQRFRIGWPGRVFMRGAERMPIVRGALLRYKFVVAIKAEPR